MWPSPPHFTQLTAMVWLDMENKQRLPAASHTCRDRGKFQALAKGRLGWRGIGCMQSGLWEDYGTSVPFVGQGT